METAARTSEAYIEYNPATRVYSYSSAATAEALPKVTPARENETRTRVTQHVTPAARHRKSRGKKALAIFVTATLAAVVMVLMIRYASIASAYTEINDIRNDIELTEREIASLNVELNTSVNIDEAREAALRAGMSYPTAEQIIDVESGSQTAMTDGE